MRCQVAMAVLVACLLSTRDAMSQTPRYFGMTLVNENEDEKLADISSSAVDCGANALFLTVQWGFIEGKVARIIRAENPGLSETAMQARLWRQYDNQIARALSHNMKIGLNIAVSTGDDASNEPSDRYGVTTNDGWLKEERMLAVSYDGQTEGVFQVAGGGALRPTGTPIYLQFVMTSLAAQSTKTRIADFTAKVMNRYKYLLDSNKLLYINLIFTRQGEGEYDGSSTKWEYNTDLGLGSGALLDYSQPMVQGFRTWLLGKYGTVGALSTAWGRTITDINTVTPKRPAGTFTSAFQGKDGRDWFLYRTYVLMEANQIFKNSAKGVDSRVKVITHHGSMFDKVLSTRRGTFAFNEIGSGLDGIKFNDEVEGGNSNGYDHRFSVDLARSNMSAGAIVVNEVGYKGSVPGFSKLVQESFDHGASMVSVFKFEEVLQNATARAQIKTLADNYVAGKNVTVINPPQTAYYTLSNMIDSDGCATSNRDAGSAGCDAYVNWNNARNAAGGAPVNIVIQNDLTTTPPCSYNLTANVSVAGTTATLTASCSGDCSGLSYSWTGGGTGTTKIVTQTSSTQTFTVTATKNGCSKTATFTVPPVSTGDDCVKISMVSAEVLTPATPKFITNAGGVPKIQVASSDANSQIWKMETSGSNVRFIAQGGTSGAGGALGVRNAGSSVGNAIDLQSLASGGHQLWTRTVLETVNNRARYKLVRSGSTYRLGSTRNNGNGVNDGETDFYLVDDPNNDFGSNKWSFDPVGCPSGPCNYTITTNVTVSNNTATMTASCSGDCSGLSYSWTGGGTSTTKMVSQTTSTQTFNVTATRSGCTKTATATVPAITVSGECVRIVMVSSEVQTPTTPKYITNVGGVAKIKFASSDANSQIWKMETSGSNIRFIAQGGTSGVGNALGVRNAGSSAGDAIDLQPLASGAHQQWTRTVLETVNNRARYKIVRSGSTYRFGSSRNNGNGGEDALPDFYLVDDPSDLFGSNKWSFDAVGCPQPNNPNPNEVVCGNIGTCSGNTSEIRSVNLSVTNGGVYSLKLTYRAYEGPTTGQVRIGTGAWTTFPTQGTSGVAEMKEVTIPNISLAAGANSVQFSVASGGSFLCFETVCTGSNSGARIGAAVEPEVEAEKPGHMVVSANPNSGTFNVSFYLSADKTAVLSVVDMRGRTWHQQQIAGKGQHNEKVVLNNPASGTYLVSLRRANAVETKKILVVR